MDLTSPPGNDSSFGKRRWARLTRSTLVGLLTVGALACAGRTPIDAPKIEKQPLPTQDEQAVEYRLQVDDLLEVKFWGNEELDQRVRIRPDGKISLPYVDDVTASGRTPRELDAELVQRYSPELARPEITVMVVETGALVYVGGEVGSEGPVALRGGLTMFQAIQAAGGFLQTARRNEILLIRRPAGEEPLARAINLRPVLSGKAPELDLSLEASDIIFVPRTKIANVNLFVQQYVNQIIPFQTITAAAALEVTRDALEETPTTNQ